MNDQELLDLNRLGFIPGPKETKEDFLSRVDYAFKFKENWKKVVPEMETVAAVSEISNTSLEKAEELFDISPSWVLVFFSNYQLLPWHGGSAWIFQENANSEVSAFFQLRSKFQYRKKYLKIYDRDELMTHEMAHIGRMMFQEPKFEELIAYNSATSSFRRYFGSIINSSKESILFLSALVISLFSDLIFINFEYDEIYPYLLIFKLLPFVFLMFCFLRLYKRKTEYKKAFFNLQIIVKDEKKVNAILYRLQDFEIQLFAKKTPKEILAYVEKEKCKSLRWKVIALSYF